MVRVLKTNGLFAIADSLQRDDDLDLNWALSQFPQDFHEPFYKNYTQKKIEDAMITYPLKDIVTDIAFLTKIVSGRKELSPS
jgi:hypothetical protein